MDRRGFLKSLGMMIGGIALGEAIPLNRVWSFPKQIVIAKPETIRPLFDEISAITIDSFQRTMYFDRLFAPSPLLQRMREAG